MLRCCKGERPMCYVCGAFSSHNTKIIHLFTYFYYYRIRIGYNNIYSLASIYTITHGWMERKVAIN